VDGGEEGGEREEGGEEEAHGGGGREFRISGLGIRICSSVAVGRERRTWWERRGDFRSFSRKPEKLKTKKGQSGSEFGRLEGGKGITHFLARKAPASVARPSFHAAAVFPGRRHLSGRALPPWFIAAISEIT
jgi:hypothetical protein